MRIFLICLLLVVSSSFLTSAQSIKIENGGEIKATNDHALQPIGAKGNLLYFMNIGMGRKVSDYEIMVFDRSDLNKTIQTINLGNVLPDIKGHNLAYYFFQHGKIYLVSSSKRLYFGSILDTEGEALSSNIPLYTADMTKATVDWAEVIETNDHGKLALVARKSIKGKTPDEFTLIPFDEEFKSENVYKIKLPEALGEGNTTDIHFGVNGCFYLAFFNNKTGGKAFVYNTKTEGLKEFDLSDHKDDEYYIDGQFHEGPDGHVWLGFTRGPICIDSYSLFRHHGGDSEPALVETYTFNKTLLEKSQIKEIIGKSCLGLPSETRLQQMVFHQDGSMHAIFEAYYMNERDMEYLIYFNDLFCVKLNNSGIAVNVATVYKSQTIRFGLTDQKAWTLGRYLYDRNLQGYGISLINSFSFYAWSQNNELKLIYNDAAGNGVKNQPYPQMTNNLNKVNLIQTTIKDEQVTKDILLESLTYELIFLPRMVIPIDGVSAISTATSKKGGLTSIYLINW